MEQSLIPSIELEQFTGVKRDMSIGDAVSICDDFALPLKMDFPFKLPFTSAVICQEGNFQATINQKRVASGRGDVVIAQCGSVVEELSASENLKTISMVFADSAEGSLFNRPAEEMSSWLIHRSIPAIIHLDEPQFLRYLRMYSLCKQLHEESAVQFKEEIVKGFISLSVASFLSILQLNEEYGGGNSPRSRQDEVFVKFRDDLQQFAGRERSVQFYADRLCISPKHFSKLIRLSSGKLPMEHIRERVIIEAKALLRIRDLSIREISDRLNFPSDSFFCRYFRQVTGLSPTDYRNQSGI